MLQWNRRIGNKAGLREVKMRTEEMPQGLHIGSQGRLPKEETQEQDSTSLEHQLQKIEELSP